MISDITTSARTAHPGALQHLEFKVLADLGGRKMSRSRRATLRPRRPSTASRVSSDEEEEEPWSMPEALKMHAEKTAACRRTADAGPCTINPPRRTVRECAAPEESPVQAENLRLRRPVRPWVVPFWMKNRLGSRTPEGSGSRVNLEPHRSTNPTRKLLRDGKLHAAAPALHHFIVRTEKEF